MIVYIATASAVVRPAKLKGKKNTYPSIQTPRNLHHIALMRYSGTSPSIFSTEQQYQIAINPKPKKPSSHCINEIQGCFTKHYICALVLNCHQ